MINKIFLFGFLTLVLAGCGNSGKKASYDITSGKPPTAAEALNEAKTTGCFANMKKMSSALAILTSQDSEQIYRTLTTVNGSSLWETLSRLDKTETMTQDIIKCPVTGKTYRGPIDSSQVPRLGGGGVYAMCENCGIVFYGSYEVYRYSKDSEDYKQALSVTCK